MIIKIVIDLVIKWMSSLSSANYNNYTQVS